MDSPEWEYGISFIREAYCENYAREIAVELGEIINDIHWPATHIDWKAASEELAMDYSEVEFDGVTYYYR